MNEMKQLTLSRQKMQIDAGKDVAQNHEPLWNQADNLRPHQNGSESVTSVKKTKTRQ